MKDEWTKLEALQMANAILYQFKFENNGWNEFTDGEMAQIEFAKYLLNAVEDAEYNGNDLITLDYKTSKKPPEEIPFDTKDLPQLFADDVAKTLANNRANLEKWQPTFEKEDDNDND